MKEIQLTQGKAAFVDDEDYERVAGYKWFARRTGTCWYACAYMNGWPGKVFKMIHLHHLIGGWPISGYIMDHRDRNGLNNQKNNLRICTQLQNRANAAGWGTTGLKGVSPHKRKGIVVGYRVFVASIYRGIYKTPEEAAKVYNQIAAEAFGEFAHLNTI